MGRFLFSSFKFPSSTVCRSCDPIFHFLCLDAQLCLTFCDPMDCSPPGSSVHGDSRQEHWSGLPFPPPGDLPNPGIEPRSSALQADSLLSEPPGKPINAIDLYKRYRCVSAAAASKSLQSCPTLCDPIDGSPPGSPSLGFSRQEHWSGLPFPSPMHEGEK